MQVSQRVEIPQIELATYKSGCRSASEFSPFWNQIFVYGDFGVDGHSAKFKNSDASICVSNVRPYSHLWLFVSVLTAL